MPHQLQIGSVVTGDIVDAVGELLAIGEQLLQVTETARHRFTPRVDDPGVRQHQVNQAQVPEVVRHLVDEERLAGAVDAGVGQILRAELPKILRTHLRKDARVAGIVQIRVTAPKIADDLLDVGKFLRAFDFECEARICSSRVEPERGRPTMKMGSGFRTPQPRRLAKNSRVHTSICCCVLHLDDFGAIPAFGALQRITKLVIAEGFRVLAPVLERLAEGKTQMITVDDRPSSARIRPRACGSALRP